MTETPHQAPPTPRRPNHERGGGIAVFSGGTAANFLVDVFDQIVTRRGRALRYIIPISDNGGSSSELIRVFGGPSELLHTSTIMPPLKLTFALDRCG